ncbi:MAG: energy transducer TonB [Bacteroidia bacterium]|nr:energy transducer TonB [Bacteroidia bacterium]
MELKKTKRADLENKRPIFILIGLAIVLGLSCLMFEWSFYSEPEYSLGEIGDIKIEEEIIPITRQEEIRPPAPPLPQISEVLNIVNDDVEIIDELDVQDVEIDQSTIIQQNLNLVQTDEEIVEEEALPFAIIEEKPSFPGGDDALKKFLIMNTQYPILARDNNIQGKVLVCFVIEKDGSVTDVKIVKGVDPLLDLEALRVVKMMPKWKPGKQRGKPVRVQYQIPLNFKI